MKLKNKPIVIGIVAPKEAGKTTVTNMIAEFVDIRESAFADKLKNTCSKVFGIERVHFDSQDLKEQPLEKETRLTPEAITDIFTEYGVTSEKMGDLSVSSKIINMKFDTPRHIAQIIGTELLRNSLSPTVHIDNVIIDKDKVTVISDTRFENEYEVMAQRQDIDYHPVYIYRNKAEEVAKTSTHASETDFFKFKDKCYVIDNNGSLRDLETNVKKFLDGVMYG